MGEKDNKCDTYHTLTIKLNLYNSNTKILKYQELLMSKLLEKIIMTEKKVILPMNCLN